MLAAFGGGALAGAIIYGAAGHHMPRRATFIGGFLLATMPWSVLSFVPGFLVAVVILAIVGIVSGPLNPLIMTVFQEQTPADMRGRVFGLESALSWVTLPLGMVIAGVTLDHVDLRATLTMIAAGYLAVSISLLLNTNLRHLTPTSTDNHVDRL